MSEMVERVALVIYQANFLLSDPSELVSVWQKEREESRQIYLRLARGAIEAMREPTEAMLDAGWHEGGEDISAMWRAMIDAAPDAAQENQ